MMYFELYEVDGSGCHGFLLWYRDRFSNLTCKRINDVEDVLTDKQADAFYNKGQSEFPVRSLSRIELL